MKNNKLPLLFLILVFLSCSEKQESTALENNLTTQESIGMQSNFDIEKRSVPEENLPIKQVIAMAKSHFTTQEKFLAGQNFSFGLSDPYTGDFSGDGKEDIVIYYSIEPTDGGNYIAGQGLSLYKNTGLNVEFITNYSPDYLFSFDKVTGGNIIISKNEYAEDDPRCCPSINKMIELSVIEDKVYERRID